MTTKISRVRLCELSYCPTNQPDFEGEEDGLGSVYRRPVDSSELLPWRDNRLALESTSQALDLTRLPDEGEEDERGYIRDFVDSSLGISRQSSSHNSNNPLDLTRLPRGSIELVP